MVVVTGAERSGTSMWMQILIAAGYEPIGEEFPRNWRESLREANRGGFWESTLRSGINFLTNPDPATGTYVRPDQVTHHVVKVFVRGLVRTDLAFLGRVVATCRHWREHAASARRLWTMEDEKTRRPPPPRLDPVVDWFAKNFMLLADMTLRGYPVKLCAYEDVLARPRETIEPILAWVGGGDLDAAVTAVHPELGHARHAEEEHSHQDACEILYEALRTGQPPDTPGRNELARAHAVFMPEVTAHEDALADYRSTIARSDPRHATET
jgi:hypothetical protein